MLMGGEDVNIIKEQDYINSYKGNKLLGLKILDLSKHKIDGSETSILALEDSILEVKNLIEEGNLKNNNIDNFYEIKEYNEHTKTEQLIKGDKLEDTLSKYLDNYIHDINNGSKIINNAVMSNMVLLFYTIFFISLILLMIFILITIR